MERLMITADVGDGSPPEPGHSAVPGQIYRLDEGVPWLRVKAELDREWERLQRLLDVVGRPGGPVAGHAMNDVPETEWWVLGADSAARWTLGLAAVPALGTGPEPVTGHVIREQLELADRLMESRHPKWGYAAGVLHWLLWITSATEEMSYPIEALDTHG
jgi:hypothetical protein